MTDKRVNRIELFGPSGVGKTTVLKALDTQSLAESGAYLFSDIEQSVKCYINSIGFSGMRAWGDLSEAGIFANQCLQKLAKTETTFSQKVEAAKMLRTTLEQYQVLPLVARENEILVADELLLHRSFALFSNSTDILDDFRWYFENTPSPAAAIYCTAEPETIAARIAARGRVINSYLYKDAAVIERVLKASQPAYDCACSILQDRGVAIKTVVMDGDKKAVSQRIAKAIQELCGRLSNGKRV